MIVKAGQLVCVDRGSYSDYAVEGFFVVLRDFDPAAVLAEWAAENPNVVPTQKWITFDPGAFLPYVLARGLLLEIDYSTWHLDDHQLQHVEFYEGPGGPRGPKREAGE